MSKTKKEILTDPLLRKGHVHRRRQAVPKPCPACHGLGTYGDFERNIHDCELCDASGILWEDER